MMMFGVEVAKIIYIYFFITIMGSETLTPPLPILDASQHYQCAMMLLAEVAKIFDCRFFIFVIYIFFS